MPQFPFYRLRVVSVILISLVIAGHQATLAGRGSVAPDHEVLRDLTGEFYARYARKDIAAFMSLWSADSPDAAARKQAAEKFFAEHDRIEIANLAIRNVKVDGVNAKASVDLSLRAIEIKTGKPLSGFETTRRLLHFMKSGGEWKVWSETSAAESLAAALVAASDEKERSALLVEDPANVELVQMLLKEGDRLRLRGDHARALTVFDLARTTAEQIPDESGAADARHNLGLVHRLQGDYAKALEEYRKSLAMRERLAQTAKTATSLNHLGYVHYLQSDYKPALEYFRKSLALSEELDDKGRTADALMSIANIHSDLGNYEQALESYQKSMMLGEAAENKAIVSGALNNAAIIHRIQGNYPQALENYEKSLQINELLGDKARTGSVLNNLGAVYRLQSDYDLALNYYRKSLSIRETLGSKAGIMASLNNIGEIYILQGNYAQALENFQKSLALSEALGAKWDGSVVLNNLGHLYQLQGDYQRSLDYYQKSLNVREALGSQEGISSTLNGLSVAYQRLNSHAQAIKAAERSAAISRRIGSRENLRAALTLMGVSYNALNQPDQARRALEDAITLVEDLRINVAGQQTRATYFAKARDPYELYIHLLMQQHQQRPAENNDARAWEISERARARSLLESLAEARTDIRHGVDLSLIKRERTLQQQLNAVAERQTRLLSGPHTPKQEEALKLEIDALAPAFQEVQSQIRRKSPRYAALTQPAPLTLKEVQRQVLDADTVLLQYTLGEEKSYLWAVTPESLTSFELPKRALIEEGTRRVRAYLSDGNGWETSATISRDYEKAATALSRMLLPDSLVGQLGTKRLVVVGDDVLQYLPFGALPVAGNQRGRFDGGPNNPAGKPAPPHSASGVTRPLILDHEIVSLPSASTLYVLRRDTARRTPVAKAVAVLADPVFDGNDERVTFAAKRTGSSAASLGRNETKAVVNNPVEPAMTTPYPIEQMNGPTTAGQAKIPSELRRAARAVGILRDGQSGLSRLPFSRREAEMILGLARSGAGLKVLDFEANQATATSAKLSEYRVVHFATHGLLNSKHPELSGIVLSLVDERGQPIDGFLRLNEIYNLDLPAELVVLSACQTALGTEIRGEGLIGLVRGFMYAGAPRVVASLWKVDDRATAELMRHFYEGLLKKNLRPAAALRQAKVEMLKTERFRAPFYWAAFELQGEWR